MSQSDGDDVGPLVADLVRTLRELEAEFEPRTESGLPRPPSPRELMRFTSDVAIPGAILILRTNIEALKLLQRALRMADGRTPGGNEPAAAVRSRAQQASKVSLSKLDGALADLQDAVEGRPEDAEARDLLEEARELRDEVEARLEDRTDGDGGPDTLADGPEVTDVPVDVDAELQSIKEEFDDGVGDGGTAANGADGDRSPDGDETGGSDSVGKGDDTGGGNDTGGSDDAADDGDE